MYYEMKKNESIGTLLKYAGGFTGDAYKNSVRVIRKTGKEYSVYNVDEFDMTSFQVADEDSVSVGGTVFSETEQRIVSVNGFKTDFKPKGRMIVFKNRDIPGVISDISGILAKSKINIADFRLGRDNDGFALAVILVDEDIKKDILDQLNALDACVWARYAVLI